MAHQQDAASSATSPSSSPSSSSPPSSITTHHQDAPYQTYTNPWIRNLRQCGLLFAGAGFMAASIAVSRRSVLRRRLETIPRFYTTNRAPAPVDSTDRSLLAVEAFGLATLNVVSFGVMLTGGIAWAFDLCSLGELRARTRASLSRPGNLDAEGERELQEVVNGLLERLGMDKIENLDEMKEKGAQAADKTPSSSSKE